MTTWGTAQWNWGSAVGKAHDAAAVLRQSLASRESRFEFVQSLKRCAADFDDAKLCLALVWQKAARRGPLSAPFAEGYAKLVNGDFEENKDAAFASTIAPGIQRYCLNVKLQVKPERVEEFEATIRQNELGTRQEPRNLRYSYGKATEGSGTYLFQEVFVGERGFKDHAAAPHFAKWEVFAATEPFAADPVVDFWEATTNFADEAPPSVVAAAALLSLDFIDDGW
eukprot:CAMPEP_0198658742 /NCGR_PEP_ID=MMETSP1467-20131203/27435_1 /TAXON_ID=1462469 /ORGANISM="unid. sp., Strain CCMP2135" /LENGTH=224 /DNA_ID=CAMNT_0044395029 /DNA_START=60 /DNA_END=734 /DNA_ORIENTATION=-